MTDVTSAGSSLTMSARALEDGGLAGVEMGSNLSSPSSSAENRTFLLPSSFAVLLLLLIEEMESRTG